MFNKEKCFFNDDLGQGACNVNCQSSTDKICNIVNSSDKASGCILNKACGEFGRINGKNDESNTDILCRANKEAEAASSRILCEACSEYNKINSGCCCESYTDVLCKLNRQAERASTSILCETCRAYNENKCRCKENSIDILCKMNKEAEATSKRILGEACNLSQPRSGCECRCNRGEDNPFNEGFSAIPNMEERRHCGNMDSFMSNVECGRSCNASRPFRPNNQQVNQQNNPINNQCNCRCQAWSSRPQCNSYYNQNYNYYGYNYSGNYGYGEDYGLWIVVLLFFFCGGAGFWCF